MEAARVAEAVSRSQRDGLVRPDIEAHDVFSLLYTLLDGIALQVATSPNPRIWTPTARYRGW
jgi:hypothetical protein